MTFRGNLLLYSCGMNFTRLRTFAARASLPRPDAPVLGRTQNFYRVLGKNFVGCSFTLDSQCGRLWLYQPRRQGLIRVCGTRQAMSRDPPQRRRARARNGVAPTSRRPFAGMPGAQATARQRRRDRNGRCKPVVFTHRTVATARNRASGFGGDWQVRQQLPVGVGPDDRMPPGSREPKVRPADRTTLQ